jgi:hypothetical protein
MSLLTPSIQQCLFAQTPTAFIHRIEIHYPFSSAPGRIHASDLTLSLGNMHISAPSALAAMSW